MSELPTEPWHQCPSEQEIREKIAQEIEEQIPTQVTKDYLHNNALRLAATIARRIK